MAQIDVNCRIPAKPKTDDKPPRPEVWPVMLEPEQEDAITFELKLFDLATKKSGDSWIDIPGWDNDDLVEKLWEKYKEWRTGYLFEQVPMDSTYRIWGNTDSKVRPTIIASEFSSDNEDRWDRKPFGTRPEEWRTENHQWDIGGTFAYIDPDTSQTVISSDFSMFNPLVELKKSTDDYPKAKVDPDSFHDGQSRGLKIKYPHQLDEVKPLIYYGMFPSGGRYGISVKDQTKSFGHYFDSELNYTYDWIDDIYFCPFDTTDATNFKITLEPYYTADAVFPDGLIITPSGKWEGFLAPRRWFFRVRYRHVVKSEDDVLSEGPYSYHQEGNPNVRNDITHEECFFWGRWPNDFSVGWGIANDFTQTALLRFYTHEGDFVADKNLVWLESMEDNREHFTTAGMDAIDANGIYCGGMIGNTHTLCDTSVNEIKVSIGSFFGASTSDMIRDTALLQPVITLESDSYYYTRWYQTPDSDNYGIKRLWKKIEDSNVWSSIIQPIREDVLEAIDQNWYDATTNGVSIASRFDGIPYGIGVSPSKEGDLVAIIRKGGKAFFIWRKTDEVFGDSTAERREWVIGENRSTLRFESNRTDGRLKEYGELHHDNLWWVAYRGYDLDVVDLYDGPATRQITSVGREIEFIEDEEFDGDPVGQAYCTGDGQIVLDTPVYIMASKEIALADVPWDVANDPSDSSRWCTEEARSRIRRIARSDFVYTWASSGVVERNKF